MRSVGNSTTGGSKIGVSSKTFQMQGGQVDLGLKQQNQNRPFLRNQDDGFNRSAGHDDPDDDGPDGDGDGNGPTRNEYSSCSMNVVSDIYYVTPAANSSSPGFWGLQPFLKSSGGMTTTAMGFPFTAAQWKELERQAMIYKYMVACLPVPPHLLYSSLPSSYLLGKYDAEAGRCRRTDGKKWRCSRDVAPNHKYCERHLHRGRPRSRKPVELVHHHQRSLCDSSVINNNNDNDNDDKKNDNATKKSRLDGPSPQFAGSSSSAPLILPPEASTFDHPMGSGPNPFEDSRSSAWNEEQQWQQLVQGNVKSLALQHQFEGVPLNLNSQADFSSKSDMGLLQSPLIDAWSMGLAGSKDNGGKNKSSPGASKGSHGNATDEDKCQIHMGLGLIDSWVASSTSPGGPLAEVLRPSSLTTVSRPELHASGSDLISAQVTKVSSPSRALRKTFVSLSDSSGSNSPTRQNSRTNSDMPFHWLN